MEADHAPTMTRFDIHRVIEEENRKITIWKAAGDQVYQVVVRERDRIVSVAFMSYDRYLRQMALNKLTEC